MKKNLTFALCVLCIAVVVLAYGTPVFAQVETHQVGEMTLTAEDAESLFKTPGYSPYAGRNFPTRVFWGDTHLHTNLSLDARAFGVTLGPEEAYRFARGEEVTSTHGERLQLSRPLDWLVIADHSDGVGAMNEIVAGNPSLLTDPTVQDWHNRIVQGGDVALVAVLDVVNAFSQGKLPEVLKSKDFTGTIWDRYLKIAEQYNEPGRFTTIIGYEWTSTEDGNNLHRNVLYRDGADLARQMLPFTADESFNPEDLWAWMQRFEDKTGGRVLTLAHNGNISNGIMFPVEVNPATGRPLTGDYAKNRIRWEPLYEVTQIKGDGEAHPFLSPNDEFADYENWDKGNLNLSVRKTDDMLQYEYAREALKNGLKLEQELGTNPYKFGMVGSTDAHTALATAEEENWFGKHAGTEPDPHRAEHPMAIAGDQRWEGWDMVGSGYAGVWATENTREALFDAMMRKEVYATTGPRMLVRFFGGWEFEAADAMSRLPGAVGYTKGVPMGGDLRAAPDGKSPTHLDQHHRRSRAHHGMGGPGLRSGAEGHRDPDTTLDGLTRPHFPNLPAPEFEGKSRIGKYGDSIMELDHRTGQVLDALRQAGVEDDTIVLWISDNGPTTTGTVLDELNLGSAGPFRGELGDAYEGSIRTAGMIRWPGKIAPGVTNEMVSIHDFFPTLAAILGAEVPKDRPVDGVDQSAFFLGEQAKSNRDHLITFVGERIAAVRWLQWRIYPLAFGKTDGNPGIGGYVGRSGETAGFPEAYNVEADPREQMNVIHSNGWLMGPYLQIIGRYKATLEDHPNPPAPDLTHF